MKIAAIYARVSSDQQKEDKTINSQTAAVMAFASTQGYSVPAEWIFEDEGFSGATLLQTQRRVERLLTAYQEDLLSLDELRRRMPELRQRETRLKAELDSLNAQLADQATYLRLAHTLGEFLERLRTQSQGLGVLERQRVVRLLVKEVIVGDDSITIRHSIPTSSRPSGGPAGSLNSRTTAADASDSRQDSLLCTWRGVAAAGQRFSALRL